MVTFLRFFTYTSIVVALFHDYTFTFHSIFLPFLLDAWCICNGVWTG
jgi:hypothetical protein